MQPNEYVGAIMAGIGVIFQYGRSFGMTVKTAIIWLSVVAFIVTLAVSEPLRAIVNGQRGFELWQALVLNGLLQLVGMVASGMGGLFGTSAAAHAAVQGGANPNSVAVPVTQVKPKEE